MTLTVAVGDVYVELHDDNGYSPDVLDSWATIATRILAPLAADHTHCHGSDD